jgi:hypothetical protein
MEVLPGLDNDDYMGYHDYVYWATVYVIKDT